MKIIKNEEGIFMEIPRNKITFYGDTEKEKQLNEILYDLSLENDSLQKEISDLQKKAELADHYKHLYSEVKKRKDELETSYDILQKNNTILAKQKEEAYKIAYDYCKENQQLKKQKDDVVEYIKHYINFRKDIYPYIDMREFDLDKLLRMLGEIDVED